MSPVCTSSSALLPARSSASFPSPSPPPVISAAGPGSSRAQTVSSHVRNPYRGPALCLISNITSLPPPDSVEMMVLFSFYK